MPAATVNVRYIVDDVDAAVAWYAPKHLGFTLISSASPGIRRCCAWIVRLMLNGFEELSGTANA